ncbi:MAG: hypothetical protein U9N34_01140, partial [Candidatus Cloacimonadota bacterium]|nr:hypothetical protein [Candidatus Cloacimonadota bacterium]
MKKHPAAKAAPLYKRGIETSKNKNTPRLKAHTSTRGKSRALKDIRIIELYINFLSQNLYPNNVDINLLSSSSPPLNNEPVNVLHLLNSPLVEGWQTKSDGVFPNLYPYLLSLKPEAFKQKHPAAKAAPLYKRGIETSKNKNTPRLKPHTSTRGKSRALKDIRIIELYINFLSQNLYPNN